MFKKFGIGMLAVALAVAFSAFTTEKKSAPSKSFNPSLYWYEVDLATQKVPRYATYFVQAEVQSVSSPCSSGLTRDCVRGFEEEINTQDGPNDDTPDDQIKTNQMP